MEPLTITVYRTVHDEFYFRVRNARDEVLLTSIHYQHRTDCLMDIYSAQRCGFIEFIMNKSSRVRPRFRFFLRLDGEFVIAESPEYLLERTLQDDVSTLTNGLRDAVLIDMSSTVRFYRRVRMD